MSSRKVIQTSGKRKTAVARAVTYQGTGRITINGLPVELFPVSILKEKIMEPINMVGENINKMDISVDVRGGGVTGQADAARTAIAKGIVEFLQDSSLEDTFKKYDRTILVNDVRRKLPKKPQGSGARAKRQKSYR